jgi:multidrug resistance efflux pump
MRLGRKIAAMEAKLELVRAQCKKLRATIMRYVHMLQDCQMVRDELKRLLAELGKKKKDSDNT